MDENELRRFPDEDQCKNFDYGKERYKLFRFYTEEEYKYHELHYFQTTPRLQGMEPVPLSKILIFYLSIILAASVCLAVLLKLVSIVFFLIEFLVRKIKDYQRIDREKKKQETNNQQINSQDDLKKEETKQFWKKFGWILSYVDRIAHLLHRNPQQEEKVSTKNSIFSIPRGGHQVHITEVDVYSITELEITFIETIPFCLTCQYEKVRIELHKEIDKLNKMIDSIDLIQKKQKRAKRRKSMKKRFLEITASLAFIRGAMQNPNRIADQVYLIADQVSIPTIERLNINNLVDIKEPDSKFDEELEHLLQLVEKNTISESSTESAGTLSDLSVLESVDTEENKIEKQDSKKASSIRERGNRRLNRRRSMTLSDLPPLESVDTEDQEVYEAYKVQVERLKIKIRNEF